MQALEEEIRTLKAEVSNLKAALVAQGRQDKATRGHSVAGTSYAQVVAGHQVAEASPTVEVAGISQEGSFNSEQRRGSSGRSQEGKWHEVRGWRIWRREPKEKVSEWQVASGRSGRKSSQPAQRAGIVTTNMFQALDDCPQDSSSKESVLVIGDSRVRYLERVFCKGRRDRRCITRPGAKVKDLVPAVAQVTSDHQFNTVIVHVGVNNIGQTRSEELLREYRALLATLKGTNRVIITGILPRARASPEWSSRALAANARVGKLCHELGFTFVDEWSRFYASWDLYQRDGLHFSEKGVHVLGKVYEHVLQGN